MKRFLIAILLGSLAGLGTQPQGLSQQLPKDPDAEENIFRVHSQLVQIYLTATEGTRRITNLKLSDFSLLEDGIAAEIEKLDNTDVPLSLALLLDSSESMREALRLTKEAAGEFVRALKSDDRVVLIPFNSDVRAIPQLTEDRSPIYDAIANAQAVGGTKLYDALLFAMKQLQSKEGRKAIVVFSDGEDTARTSSLEVVLNAAARYGIPIYAIAAGSSLQREQLQRVLRQLAEINSGRMFPVANPNDLRGAFDEVLSELHSAYVLNYYTGVPPDGRWHDVKLSVLNPRCKIHCRTGFYARTGATQGLFSDLGMFRAEKARGLDGAEDALASGPGALRAAEELLALSKASSPAEDKPLRMPPEIQRARAAADKAPVFRVESRFVEVPVVIESIGQTEVAPLLEKDFRVYEDGILREIAIFSKEAQMQSLSQLRDGAVRKLSTTAELLPVSSEGQELRLGRFFLVLDDLMTESGAFMWAKKAAIQFLRENHSPLRPISLHFTSQVDASILAEENLEAMISRLQKAAPRASANLTSNDGYMSVFEAYLIEHGDRQAQALAELRYAGTVAAQFENELGRVDGDTGTTAEMIRSTVSQSANELVAENSSQAARALGSLTAAVSAAASDPGQYPKEVILISGGFCLGRQSLRAGTVHMLEGIVEIARRQGIRLFTIDAAALDVDEPLGMRANASFLVRNPHLQGILANHARDWRQERQSPLHELAAATRGRFLHSTNDLVAAARQAVGGMGQLYYLGYVSKQPADGRFHQIRVTTSARNSRIYARKGYFAVQSGGAKPSQAANLEGTDWGAVLARANEARRTGNVQELTTSLELLVQRYPGQMNFWYHLGIAQLQAGNAHRAVSALQQAYSLAPEDRSVGIALTQSLLSAGYRAAAGQTIETMLLRHPRDFDLLLYLGRVYEATGRPEKAYQAYRRILDLKRNPPLEVFLLLTRTAVGLGRQAEADVFMQDYLAGGGLPDRLEEWRRKPPAGSN
jgi:Ca-activated chloride channel family protein